MIHMNEFFVRLANTLANEMTILLTQLCYVLRYDRLDINVL